MSSLKRSCASPEPTRALLSIKPRFVDAILAGVKRFEFRRSIFSRPVDVVVIYATDPVQRIIAEFDVKGIMEASPDLLWKRTKEFAGIDQDGFYEYFNGKNKGYAIEVGEVRVYDTPLHPVRDLGVRPPQSFLYLRDQLPN